MQGVSFQRKQDYEGPKASLWRVDDIDAYGEQGQKLGFIRISYVPSERVERWEADVFAFLADRGTSFGIHCKKDIANLPDEDLARLAHEIHNALDGWSAATAAKWEIQPRHAILDAFEQWRPRLEDLVREKREAFVAFHVDRPLVDMISVEESFRGRHLGRELYRQAAMWMAERGLRLHASGVQTDDAQRLWGKMEDQGLVEKAPDGRRIYRVGRP